MKITITLTEAEVKGIKSYLKEVDENPRPNKEDISLFVGSLVESSMYYSHEAVSDHIKRAEEKLANK